MPLTSFQLKLAQLLAQNRTEDSHMAGGAALHFEPNSLRYSMDLDYFHDLEARVASAFSSDRDLLKKNGFSLSLEINQPGYIRCIVQKGQDFTKIEWAQDSSWRFMPVQADKSLGYVLHPVDLAINKVLALAGRDEARDYLDVHYTHKRILPLGAQVWATCGKDPGFNPLSLLEILRRRGKYHAEDFERLNLVHKIDLQELKKDWLAMLADAEIFVRLAPASDLGCLYFSKTKNTFIQPKDFTHDTDCIRHFGKPGGIIPRIITE